jgi:hypothetical protein
VISRSLITAEDSERKDSNLTAAVVEEQLKMVFCNFIGQINCKLLGASLDEMEVPF